MSNAITRRLAIFRIATASAVATAVTAPAVLAAVQPKQPENPELLRLGRHLAKLDALCQRRVQAKAKARSTFEALAPALPAEIIVTRDTRYLAQYERETDCEGKTVWPTHACLPPRNYHSVDNLQQSLNHADTDDAEREILQPMLAVAEEYERGIEAAHQQSGARDAIDRLYSATHKLELLVRRIAEIPSQTPDGITIKARAYQAFACLGTEPQYKAALILGPGLAADIARLLTDGDDA